jgi:hypothetical protein
MAEPLCHASGELSNGNDNPKDSNKKLRKRRTHIQDTPPSTVPCWVQTAALRQGVLLATIGSVHLSTHLIGFDSAERAQIAPCGSGLLPSPAARMIQNVRTARMRSMRQRSNNPADVLFNPAGVFFILAPVCVSQCVFNFF